MPGAMGCFYPCEFTVLFRNGRTLLFRTPRSGCSSESVNPFGGMLRICLHTAPMHFQRPRSPLLFLVAANHDLRSWLTFYLTPEVRGGGAYGPRKTRVGDGNGNGGPDLRAQIVNCEQVNRKRQERRREIFDTIYSTLSSKAVSSEQHETEFSADADVGGATSLTNYETVGGKFYAGVFGSRGSCFQT